MNIAYVWPAGCSSSLTLDYWLTIADGHAEVLTYLARYYSVQVFAGCFTPVDTMRDGFALRLRPEWSDRLQLLRDFQPDAVVCYGPAIEACWDEVRDACPNAVLALDYGGGPLTDLNGNVRQECRRFDWIFTAHETQARLLRDGGVRATKARGVPTNRYRPMPGVAKRWHVFCPTTFVAGKRPGLVAQALEQFAPEKPSLFAGWMEHPAVVDMVRWGNIPLNKAGVQLRNNIELAGRIPYALMPYCYNASQVCITGSGEEAGPYVPLEAMACGTPAIVMADMEHAAADAFRELCADNQGRGLRVVAPSPEGIHAAIESILADYEAESKAARRAILRSYEWFSSFYAPVDRILKNCVGLKQAGQPVEYAV